MLCVQSPLRLEGPRATSETSHRIKPARSITPPLSPEVIRRLIDGRVPIETHVLETLKEQLDSSPRIKRIATPKTSRRTTEFEDNCGSSLALVEAVNTSAGLVWNHRHEDPEDLFGAESNDPASVCERIRHHAYMRVQTFYQQLVAYAGEQCTIRLGKTKQQHGVSHCPKCSAAHSTLLPRLKDNYFLNLARQIDEEGVTMKTTVRLLNFGVSTRELSIHYPALETKEIDGLEFLKRLGIGKRKSLAQGLQTDTTVQLPSLVNRFDNVLEASLRPGQLEILNAVSQGLYSPYEALCLFRDKIREFLAKCAETVDEAIMLYETKECLETNLATLEKSGSASGEEYLRHVYDLCQVNLRINSLPSVYLISVPKAVFPEARRELYYRIISHLTKEAYYVAQLTDLHALQTWCERYGHITGEKRFLTLAEDAFSHTHFATFKQSVLAALHSYDPVTLLLKDSSRRQKCFDGLDELDEGKTYHPDSHKRTLQSLRNVLKVIRWQCQGSFVPEEHLLAGKRAEDLEERKLCLYGSSNHSA